MSLQSLGNQHCLVKAPTLDLGAPTPRTPILPILRHQPQGLRPYLSRWIRSKDCPPTFSLASFLARPSSSTSPSVSARPSALSSSAGPFGSLLLPLNLLASFFLLFLRLPLSLQVHELWTSLCSICVLEMDIQNWSVLIHFYTSFTNDQRTRLLEGGRLVY